MNLFAVHVDPNYEHFETYPQEWLVQATSEADAKERVSKVLPNVPLRVHGPLAFNQYGVLDITQTWRPL